MACLKTFTKFGFRTSTDKWPGLHSITHREKHPSRSPSLFLFLQYLSSLVHNTHTHTHTHRHAHTHTHTQLAAAEEASLRHLKLLISFLSRYMQPTVKCYKSNMSVSAEHTQTLRHTTHTHTARITFFPPLPLPDKHIMVESIHTTRNSAIGGVFVSLRACQHVSSVFCVFFACARVFVTEFRRSSIMETLLTCYSGWRCVDRERETTSDVMLGTAIEINDGHNGTLWSKLFISLAIVRSFSLSNTHTHTHTHTHTKLQIFSYILCNHHQQSVTSWILKPAFVTDCLRNQCDYSDWRFKVCRVFIRVQWLVA